MGLPFEPTVTQCVIPSVDFVMPPLTMLHENARSALECGSSSYRLRFMRHMCKAVAAATALQGACGATIFKAARNLALACGGRNQSKIPRYARNDNCKLNVRAPLNYKAVREPPLRNLDLSRGHY